MSTAPVLNVFIIDDSDVTRSMLRLIVQSANHLVVGEAGSASSAKERVAGLRPDIMLLDLVLPDCDNFDLFDWLVSQLPTCVVVVMSARNDRDTVRAAFAKGAKGFVIKPFNTGTVQDSLRTAAQYCQRTQKGG